MGADRQNAIHKNNSPFWAQSTAISSSQDQPNVDDYLQTLIDQIKPFPQLKDRPFYKDGVGINVDNCDQSDVVTNLNDALKEMLVALKNNSQLAPAEKFQEIQAVLCKHKNYGHLIEHQFMNNRSNFSELKLLRTFADFQQKYHAANPGEQHQTPQLEKLHQKFESLLLTQSLNAQFGVLPKL